MRLILIAKILILGYVCEAQNIDWIWARSDGGSDHDISKSVSIDCSGNVYQTGYFKSPTIILGPVTYTNFYYYYTDFFLEKYDKNGNFKWAHVSGRDANDEGYGVTNDTDGNVIVTGRFNSPTVTFNPYVLTNTGSYDMFLVKFDSTGHILWAKNTVGTSIEEGRSICTDKTGNIYVAGIFRGTNIILDSTVLTNVMPGYSDVFLAKYDKNGHLIWAKSFGGEMADEAVCIVTDTAGNVFFSGNTTSITYVIDSLTMTNSNSHGDIVIAKFDSSGHLQWAKNIGGNGLVECNKICTDPAGNVFMTGHYNNYATYFDSFLLGSCGYSDFFIVKYNSNGNAVWAKTPGGSSSDGATGICCDSSGNVYALGWFNAYPIVFGNTTLNNPPSGGSNTFIVQYGSSGNVLWANTIGRSLLFEYLTIGCDDKLAYAGIFDSPNLIFGSTILPNNGMNDFFVAKFAENTTVTTNINFYDSCIVYPNPVYNSLNINLIADSDINIYDISGNLIRSLHLQSGNLEINVNDLDQGIYVLTIRNKQSVSTLRFIKGQ